MTYIGLSPPNTFTKSTSQTFSGNGSTTDFTLQTRVSSPEDLEVFVSNVQQQPTVSYTIGSDGVTMSFPEAPPSGTFYVIYRTVAQQSGIDTGASRLGENNTFTGNQTITGTLSVSADTDATTTLGRALIHSPSSDIAVFSHVDKTASTDYALRQNANGTTYLNSPSGGIINFNINNSNKASIDSNGLDVAGSTTVGTTLSVTGATTLSSTVRSVGNFDVNTNKFIVNATSGNTSVAGTLSVTGDVTASADVSVGDDIKLVSDTSAIQWGANSEIYLAHVHNLGLRLYGQFQSRLELGFSTNYIDGSTSGTLEIDATDKIELDSTLIDVNGKLDVSGSGGDYIATFQNTTSGTPYGVIIKEPSSAGAGYPLLALTNHDGSTTRFRVDSSTGHVGINRSPTANDTLHINDTTPRIKLEETSTGGSKMLVLGVEADGDPFIDAPQSGGNIMFNLTGRNSVQFADNGVTNNPVEVRLRTGSGGINQCITGTNWGYSDGYEAFMLGRDDTATEGTFSFGYNPRINGNGGFTGDGREVIFRRGMKFMTPTGANNGWYTQFTMIDGVSSGDFNDTSDEKLKQNINDVSEGISIIKQLRPVIFDWKDEGKGNGLGGFIAQEVQKILPNDVMGKEYVAPDREKDIEGTDGLSINTTSIVAHLTKALQEAIAKIETLEAKVKVLEEA